MTVEQLVDEIKAVVSDIPDTMVINRIDQTQKYYADKTECYTGSSNITIAAATVTYLLSSINAYINKVTSVRYYDSSGEELLGSDALKFEISNGYITFYDYMGNEITSIPDNIAAITLHYIKIPSTLSSTDYTDTPDIPEQFHTALVYKTLSDILAMKKDYNGSGFYLRLYKEIEKEAIIYGTQQQNRVPMQIKPDFY